MAAGTPDRRSTKPNGTTPQPNPPNLAHQPHFGYGVPQFMPPYPLHIPPAQMYAQHHHIPYPHYAYQQPIYQQHPMHPQQGYPSAMQYMPHMPAPHPHYPSPTIGAPYPHVPSPWSSTPSSMPPTDPGISTPPVYSTPPYAPPAMHHSGQTLYQSSQPFVPRNVPPSPSSSQIRHLASPRPNAAQTRSPSLSYARIPDQSQPGPLISDSSPSHQMGQPSLPSFTTGQQNGTAVAPQSPKVNQPPLAVEPVPVTISSLPSQPPPQPPPLEETQTRVEMVLEDDALRFAGGRIPTPNADSIITFAAPSSVPSTSSPPPNDTDAKDSTYADPTEQPPPRTILAPIFGDVPRDIISKDDVPLLSPTTSASPARDISEPLYFIATRRPDVKNAPALSFSKRAKMPATVITAAVPIPPPSKATGRSIPALPRAEPSALVTLANTTDSGALIPRVDAKGPNTAFVGKLTPKTQKAEGPKPPNQPTQASEAHLTAVQATLPATPPASVAPDPATASPAPAPPAVPAPALPVKQPPKSWASLLRPASPAKTAKSPQGQPQKPLPGSVVPLSSGVKPAAIVEPKVNGDSLINGAFEPLPTNVPLHVILAEGVQPYSARSQVTQPRGLINSGNMCFANVVLQALVHSAPFARLFETLAQLVPGNLSGKTSLYEATILFLREFPPQTEPTPLASKAKPRSGASTPMPPEQTRQQSWNENPFVPELLYEAMKQNKRFDSMQRGHQEDAEEFLGFFLDTLHEELLSMLSRVQTDSPSTGPVLINGPNGNPTQGENAREVQRPVSPDKREDDSGWLEVGKKNRAAVTRTTRATESAITRIFGGKLRSVLQTPGSKDSVTLEPYQPLQLDIQSDNVRTIEDALRHITMPETVSVFSETRGGIVDAKKQVTLESLPPLLILHLKRLVYDAKGIQKNSKVIEYSTTLEIRPEIISPTKRTKKSIKYCLYGVVYHHGKHATGGHYTIDVLRQDHSEWVRIDDTHIEPVTEKDVTAHEKHAKLDKTAYLLFYRRESEPPK